MKMKVKKLLSVLVSLFCCINCMNMVSYAKIDLTHTFVDERGLQENTWINLKCISKNEGCKKYLIRYEDAKKLEEIFKSLIKDNKSNKDTIKNLQKAGILVTGLAGGTVSIYFAPLTTLKILTIGGLSAPTMCSVYNGVIDPTVEVIGVVPQTLVKVINWVKSKITGEQPVNYKPKGIIGNTMDTLCGDKSKENFNEGLLEGLRRIIFGDIESPNITSITDEKRRTLTGALNDFYNQIKNKKYKDNDIIVLSTNFAPGHTDAKIKFDKTWVKLKYEKPVDEYFKKIKK